jgi:hypothetical protein
MFLRQNQQSSDFFAANPAFSNHELRVRLGSFFALVRELLSLAQRK